MKNSRSKSIGGKSLWKLIRPNQWIKNLILFLPLFFGQEIRTFDKLMNVLILFAGFCLLSSSIYIFNDLMDKSEDRLHPIKKHRPIASGKITLVKAILFIVILLIGAFSCFSQIENNRLHIFYLAIGYIFLNIGYSLGLKRITIIDAVLIACGFNIRLAAGAEASLILLSHWLIIITFILSLFLAFAKKRGDLANFIDTGNISRKNITQYSLEYLNVILSFLAATITVVYILYTLSPDVIVRTSPHLYITIPFVLTGIMRYLQILLVERKESNPTDILLKDKILQLTVVGWIITFSLLIY